MNPYLAIYPIGHLPSNEKIQANLVLEKKLIHNGHYEMEKCLDPLPFTTTIPWETIPYGDEEWVFALARHSIFTSLCHCYKETGDKKYLDALLFHWKDFIRTQGPGKKTWRSLECGIRAEVWLRIIALLPFEIPFLDEVTDSLRRQGSVLRETHTSFHKLSNWGVIGDHGLLALALFFEDKEWEETAVSRLEEELALQTQDDGSFWEQSPLYHAHVLHSALDTVRMLRIANRQDALIETETKKLARSLAGSCYGKSHLFPQGDSDLLDCSDLLTEASLLFQAPELFRGVQAENLLDHSKDAWRDNQAERKRVSPKTTCFPDSGNWYLRKGAFEVHFHAGFLGSGHGHLDEGHVDIALDGNLLFGDSGRYTYQDIPVRQELKGPGAHNTLYFAKDAEAKGSWSYTALAQAFGGRCKETKDVDAVEAYILHPNGERSRRRVLLFSDILVVIDDLQSEKNEASIAWHAMPKRTPSNYLYSQFLGTTDMRQEPCMMSRCYNILEESTKQVLEIQGLTAFSLFATKPFTATAIPLTLESDGSPIAEEYGTGLRITMDGKHIDLISRRKEFIHQVDIVQAGDCHGYGSLLVSIEEKQTRLFSF
jgi:hypothetical protein